MSSNKQAVKNIISNVGSKILQPYSRLLLRGDSANWVLSWEMRELARIAKQIGIRLMNEAWYPITTNQSVFFANHFAFFKSEVWHHTQNHLAIAYLHGRPGTGEEEFDQAYKILHNIHPFIQRVQVTHREMQEIVLSTGIDPIKVFRIPIGINLKYFPNKNAKLQETARKHFGIPQSAVVIGSFQKDGIGWGEGLQPKLIKGPDIFLKTVAQLKTRIPELFIILSGPARGFVKQGLEQLKIPYYHTYTINYPDIGKLYQAIDLYLITSRQEGGPKALLESMASGVPLITTQIGQAKDLVHHGENAWMVDVDDIDGLTNWADFVLNHRGDISGVLHSARQTAEAYSYDSLKPLWQSFMEGFVKWGD